MKLTVVKLLLFLSHGQASVERGFSVNKETIADHLSQKALVGWRVICDHVRTVGGVLNVSITKELMQQFPSVEKCMSNISSKINWRKQQRRESKRESTSRRRQTSSISNRRELNWISSLSIKRQICITKKPRALMNYRMLPKEMP